jgi:hypothetical protein
VTRCGGKFCEDLRVARGDVRGCYSTMELDESNESSASEPAPSPLTARGNAASDGLMHEGRLPIMDAYSHIRSLTQTGCRVRQIQTTTRQGSGCATRIPSYRPDNLLHAERAAMQQTIEANDTMTQRRYSHISANPPVHCAFR